MPHRGRRRVFVFGLGWHLVTSRKTIQSSEGCWGRLVITRALAHPRTTRNVHPRTLLPNAAARCQLQTQRVCRCLCVCLYTACHVHPRTHYFARSRHTLLPGAAQLTSLSLQSPSLCLCLSLSLSTSIFISFHRALSPRRASPSVSLPLTPFPLPAPYLHPVPAQHLHPFQGRDVDTDHQ